MRFIIFADAKIPRTIDDNRHTRLVLVLVVSCQAQLLKSINPISPLLGAGVYWPL